MKKEIWFDMDGTIADLYGVQGWLSMLQKEDATPYRQAKPLVSMSTLARLLHKAQKHGYTINIISWCAKHSTAEYDIAVTQAKCEWLKKHLPSVGWNKIDIVAYGTPKGKNRSGILFDDELNNRIGWTNGIAYDEKNILTILRAL